MHQNRYDASQGLTFELVDHGISNLSANLIGHSNIFNSIHSNCISSSEGGKNFRAVWTTWVLNTVKVYHSSTRNQDCVAAGGVNDFSWVKELIEDRCKGNSVSDWLNKWSLRRRYRADLNVKAEETSDNLLLANGKRNSNKSYRSAKKKFKSKFIDSDEDEDDYDEDSWGSDEDELLVANASKSVSQSESKEQLALLEKKAMFENLKSIPNILIIQGPTGTRKTEMIHDIADRLGFNVVEVNTAQVRSAGSMKRLIYEASQSHRIIMKEVISTNNLFPESDSLKVDLTKETAKDIASASAKAAASSESAITSSSSSIKADNSAVIKTSVPSSAAISKDLLVVKTDTTTPLSASANKKKDKNAKIKDTTSSNSASKSSATSTSVAVALPVVVEPKKQLPSNPFAMAKAAAATAKVNVTNNASSMSAVTPTVATSATTIKTVDNTNASSNLVSKTGATSSTASTAAANNNAATGSTNTSAASTAIKSGSATASSSSKKGGSKSAVVTEPSKPKYNNPFERAKANAVSSSSNSNKNIIIGTTGATLAAADTKTATAIVASTTAVAAAVTSSSDPMNSNSTVVHTSATSTDKSYNIGGTASSVVVAKEIISIDIDDTPIKKSSNSNDSSCHSPINSESALKENIISAGKDCSSLIVKQHVVSPSSSKMKECANNASSASNVLVRNANSDSATSQDAASDMQIINLESDEEAGGGGDDTTLFLFEDGNNAGKKKNIHEMNLILFDEVDIVFEEEDTNFFSSIQQLARISKCPIVLTTQELQLKWMKGLDPMVVRLKRLTDAQIDESIDTAIKAAKTALASTSSNAVAGNDLASTSCASLTILQQSDPTQPIVNTTSTSAVGRSSTVLIASASTKHDPSVNEVITIDSTAANTNSDSNHTISTTAPPTRDLINTRRLLASAKPQVVDKMISFIKFMVSVFDGDVRACEATLCLLPSMAWMLKHISALNLSEQAFEKWLVKSKIDFALKDNLVDQLLVTVGPDNCSVANDDNASAHLTNNKNNNNKTSSDLSLSTTVNDIKLKGDDESAMVTSVSIPIPVVFGVSPRTGCAAEDFVCEIKGNNFMCRALNSEPTKNYMKNDSSDESDSIPMAKLMNISVLLDNVAVLSEYIRVTSNTSITVLIPAKSLQSRFRTPSGKKLFTVVVALSDTNTIPGLQIRSDVCGIGASWFTFQYERFVLTLLPPISMGASQSTGSSSAKKKKKRKASSGNYSFGGKKSSSASKKKKIESSSSVSEQDTPMDEEGADNNNTNNNNDREVEDEDREEDIEEFSEQDDDEDEADTTTELSDSNANTPIDIILGNGSTVSPSIGNDSILTEDGDEHENNENNNSCDNISYATSQGVGGESVARRLDYSTATDNSNIAGVQTGHRLDIAEMSFVHIDPNTASNANNANNDSIINMTDLSGVQGELGGNENENGLGARQVSFENSHTNNTTTTGIHQLPPALTDKEIADMLHIAEEKQKQLTGSTSVTTQPGLEYTDDECAMAPLSFTFPIRVKPLTSQALSATPLQVAGGTNSTGSNTNTLAYHQLSLESLQMIGTCLDAFSDADLLHTRGVNLLYDNETQCDDDTQKKSDYDFVSTSVIVSGKNKTTSFGSGSLNNNNNNNGNSSSTNSTGNSSGSSNNNNGGFSVTDYVLEFSILSEPGFNIGDNSLGANNFDLYSYGTRTGYALSNISSYMRSATLDAVRIELTKKNECASAAKRSMLTSLINDYASSKSNIDGACGTHAAQNDKLSKQTKNSNSSNNCSSSSVGFSSSYLTNQRKHLEKARFVMQSIFQGVLLNESLVPKAVSPFNNNAQCNYVSPVMAMDLLPALKSMCISEQRQYKIAMEDYTEYLARREKKKQAKWEKVQAKNKANKLNKQNTTIAAKVNKSGGRLTKGRPSKSAVAVASSDDEEEEEDEEEAEADLDDDIGFNRYSSNSKHMYGSDYDDEEDEEDDGVRYSASGRALRNASSSSQLSLRSSRSTRSSSRLSSGDADASGNNVRPAPVKYTHLKAVTGLDELTLDSLVPVYN